MEKQFIDIAYDVAKTKYAKKAFTFEQVWNDLVKKARLDEEEKKKAGDVYTAMLQDTRFIFVGKGLWKLREFLTLEEQAKLSNALYDFTTEVEEEGEEAVEAKRKRASKEAEDTYYDDEMEEEMYNEAKQQALEESEADDEDEEKEEEEE